MLIIRSTGTAFLVVSLLLWPIAASPQTPAKKGDRVQGSARNEAQAPEPAIEPHVTNVLKVMSKKLDAAQNYSFRAHVMREEPATNGQMLEFFRYIRIEVKRPNKLHVTVKADNSESEFFDDGKTVTLYHPQHKLYSSMPAPASIEATLQMLKDKLNTHMYLTAFLVRNTFDHLTEGLKTGHMVGFVNIGEERLLHMAFTEDGADWQLWVTGPKEILPHRLAILYKTEPGAPRVNVVFTDWNLNAQTPDSAFAFSKPPGSTQVSLDALRRRAPGQTGGKKQ